jgi:ketosteroid isomerase-like protein
MTEIALAQTILRRWGDAIAARDWDAVAQMFDDNAVFMATAPAPLQGRRAIAAYYADAPMGLTVQATLALAVRHAQGISIVADVVFDLPAKGALRGRLSLACDLVGQITLYHMALG